MLLLRDRPVILDDDDDDDGVDMRNASANYMRAPMHSMSSTMFPFPRMEVPFEHSFKFICALVLSPNCFRHKR